MFKQALVRRGLPARLYVDNGANYRSHHLALVCAKLGVALIHARPINLKDEVDAALVGETVTLRFDPHAPPGRPVQVVLANGRCRPQNRSTLTPTASSSATAPRTRSKPTTPPPEPPQSRLALRDLNRRDDEQRIDYNGGDGHNNEERG